MGVIDDYIAGCSRKIRPQLTEISEIIRRALPGASEKISWNMPTFFLNGNVVHFAAHKDHIGFYPSSSGVEHFAERLSAEGWSFSKGSIRFPYDKPLPAALISDICLFRLAENLHKTVK